MKVTARPTEQTTITMKTTEKKDVKGASKWWLARSQGERASQLISTAAYLKDSQNYRYRQTGMFARLYGNQSLFNFIGSSANKLESTQGLPSDRPTFNLVQSATDTLVAKIAQTRPQPVFLTDNGDYKQRNLAKKLNNFIQGEFYQTKAYEKGPVILRDACVTGDGCLKVFETDDHRVGLERVLLTELLIDQSEAMYGDPRQLYQLKLVDRAVLMAAMPGHDSVIAVAEKATPDQSADSSKTVSDLVMVVEGWRLPSGPNKKDGRHTIACSAGPILDEEWTKQTFPFVFLHYSPRLLGFWAQGLAEQLMGTQLEINSLLFTISKAIKLVGVPRVFIEKGSKVSKAAFNNDIGTLIEYSGTKPIYEVAPCVPAELYAQLQRLIQYGYQQCGVSALQAQAEKPAGLDSGEAIRSYDDIATDRFATLARRYDDFYIALAYQIIALAKEIADRDGKYQTVYPNKNSAKEIDLTKADLVKDDFVIQCYNMSSLPKDPSGRMAKVTEMIQAGFISIQEGRRLLDYPDLEQIETLANAAEERIFQYLDAIIEDGKYTGPDPFMDLKLAKTMSVAYINLYSSSKLEEEKLDKLRMFFNQAVDMISRGVTPEQPEGAPAAAPMGTPPGAPGASPNPGNGLAVPEALPTSNLLPQAQPAA